eukprot:5437120-Prymnesium_polylepis.1
MQAFFLQCPGLRTENDATCVQRTSFSFVLSSVASVAGSSEPRSGAASSMKRPAALSSLPSARAAAEIEKEQKEQQLVLAV